MSRSTNPVNARALACLFPHYCKDSGIGHIFHSLGVHWTSDRLRATMIVPNDAAGTNESHFYFIVKDDNGGEKKSQPIFVDRAPFKFSN